MVVALKDSIEHLCPQPALTAGHVLSYMIHMFNTRRPAAELTGI
uniref:Uncharacterized protein n=1 Tax=Anguilla anguilla TaxID=7936 RepID=A0A0E9T9N0_ANGAN